MRRLYARLSPHRFVTESVFGAGHTAEARQWFEDMWDTTLRQQSEHRDTLRPMVRNTTETEWDEMRHWIQKSMTHDANSPNSMTASLCQFYVSLRTKEDKTKFIAVVASFGISPEGVKKTLARTAQLLDNPATGTPDDTTAHEKALSDSIMRTQDALTPMYHNWFRQVIGLPSGLQFLITLREDVLDMVESHPTGQMPVHGIHLFLSSLTSLLRGWISVGWMHLHEISWMSSAAVLSNVAKMEAVHPIANIDALQLRVGPTLCRRCYGYFHPSLPCAPLVMIFVAFTQGISANVQDIIHHRDLIDEHKVDTAVFYSISSTQKGLRGIDLGHYLIKGVVDEIKSTFPTVSTFTTLSPIPNFVPWLKSRVQHHDVHRVMDAASFAQVRAALCLPEDATEEATLKHLVALVNGSEHWWEKEALRATLERPLMQAAARYLYTEKKRGKAYDPVANFHIRNGATMHRLNYAANPTGRGSRSSATIMVNYLYDLSKIVSNAVGYDVHGTVAVSECVKALL